MTLQRHKFVDEDEAVKMKTRLHSQFNPVLKTLLSLTRLSMKPSRVHPSMFTRATRFKAAYI